MQTIDNMNRTMVEDLLLDTINIDAPIFAANLESFDDVNAQNRRVNNFNDRIKALAALMLLKDSYISDVKRDDAIKGNICYNRETNCIEYFDGNAWHPNIFGPNTVLDAHTYLLKDLNPEKKDGITVANIAYIDLKQPISDDKVIFIIADGSVLDQAQFYIDPKNDKRISFATPLSVYESVTYYVLAGKEKSSGSIPKYEVVSYVSDGSRTVYPISNSENFIATYKSSIDVYVNGACVPVDEYNLTGSKNSIAFRLAPETGAKIEIRTLFGIETDFRGSLCYVEQITKATVARQKTFQYNGVSEAIKVYLDGKRLVINEHFKFNYVQKLVVLDDSILDEVKEGSIVIVEKEMAPMSKEPMYGSVITESKLLEGGSTTLSHACNGIACVIGMDTSDQNREILIQQDYYLNGQVLNITKEGYETKKVQVTYLTNVKTPTNSIPEIDDLANDSTVNTYSITKIMQLINSKLDSAGNIHQDVQLNNLRAFGSSIIDGNVISQNNIKAKNLVEGRIFKFGDPENSILEYNEESNKVIVSETSTFRKNVEVVGNLEVRGQYIGKKLESVNVERNNIMLNANKTIQDEPETESYIEINRGKNGKEKLLFSEAENKWKVQHNSDQSKEISIEGHKHSGDDFLGSKIPKFDTLTSMVDNTETTDRVIEDKLMSSTSSSPTDKVKSIGKLNIDRGTILPGENGQNDLTSSSVLKYDLYKATWMNQNQSHNNLLESAAYVFDNGASNIKINSNKWSPSKGNKDLTFTVTTNTNVTKDNDVLKIVTNGDIQYANIPQINIENEMDMEAGFTVFLDLKCNIQSGNTGDWPGIFQIGTSQDSPLMLGLSKSGGASNTNYQLNYHWFSQNSGGQKNNGSRNTTFPSSGYMQLYIVVKKASVEILDGRDLSRLIYFTPTSIESTTLRKLYFGHAFIYNKAETYFRNIKVFKRAIEPEELKRITWTKYEKKTPLAIVEDGSTILEGRVLALPEGNDSERWNQSDTFDTAYDKLSNDKWKRRNGLIRYNNEQNCVEFLIDSSWVKLRKPDMPTNKQSEMFFDRGRFVQEFSISDFSALSSTDAKSGFGLTVGEKVLKIRHNLGTTFVRVDIFDDKRTSFPLLYKCIDENTVYLTFPSDIQDISGSTDINRWFDFLKSPLHFNKTTEGPGHENKCNTFRNLDTTKKFVAFVTGL